MFPVNKRFFSCGSSKFSIKFCAISFIFSVFSFGEILELYFFSSFSSENKSILKLSKFSSSKLEILDYRFGKNNDFNYNDLLNVDLLIIDDLGTESSNNMKFSELFNILNTRLLNQNNHVTKTIISTNLSLNHLFKTYDERIFSRLVGYYNICRFFGEDLRYKK